MRTYYLLLLITVLFGSEISFAQETYQQNFAGLDGEERQDDIKKMKNGGYIITGSTLNVELGKYDAYCIKLDKKGNMLWSKTYNSLLSDYVTKSWGTADGGFILAFTSRTSRYWVEEDTLKSIFVVKCDSNGNVQWSKCIISPLVISYNTRIHPTNIYQSKSGDYYLLCDWFTGNDVPQFSLFKLNMTGTLMWKKTVYTKNWYHYESKQITELGNGDIIVVESADGDEFYSSGNFIHLFVFSAQTGGIKQSKAINQYDNVKQNRNVFVSASGYVDAYNITVENNKINVTGRYSQEDYYDKICWFSLKLNDTLVKGSYIAYKGYPSFNYLINKGYIKQPAGSFLSDLIFTKGGGFINTYGYLGITINKSDSLGRICPNYAIPVVDTKIHKTNFTVKDIPYFVLKHTVFVRDTFVIVKDITAQETICIGTAPLIAENKKMLTSSAAAHSKTNLQLYPNPSKDILHIAGLQDAATLTIINTLGVVVKRMNVNIAGGTINIKQLPAGTYYVQVQSNSSTITLPFIKE